MDNLIGYIMAHAGQPLPAFDETHLYEYILAGNGLFVRSKRDGLEATIPVAFAKVQGLAEVAPAVRMTEKLPAWVMETILTQSKTAWPNEILFWIGYENQVWEVFVPPQTCTPGNVMPLDPFHPKGACALVDAHSHGAFHADFSSTDDADETGFRLYLCIGNGGNEIAARIGIFGNMWDIPIPWVCGAIGESHEYCQA